MSRERSYEGDDIQRGLRKTRTCLKCRVQFTVIVSLGNWYTCDKCRRSNEAIRDRPMGLPRTAKGGVHKDD